MRGSSRKWCALRCQPDPWRISFQSPNRALRHRPDGRRPAAWWRAAKQRLPPISGCLTGGAYMVLKRCAPRHIEHCTRHLQPISWVGLRTLVVCMRPLVLVCMCHLWLRLSIAPACTVEAALCDGRMRGWMSLCSLTCPTRHVVCPPRHLVCPTRHVVGVRRLTPDWGIPLIAAAKPGARRRLLSRISLIEALRLLIIRTFRPWLRRLPHLYRLPIGLIVERTAQRFDL